MTERDRLHAAISDALWLERYTNIMESTCELADLVLEALSYEPCRDGVGPWPHHHESTLMSHLTEIEKAGRGDTREDDR